MAASNDLKKIFAENGGGSEKDWKRRSKKNNDAGQPVRIFENTKTGARLEVTEVGENQFTARKLGDAAAEAFAVTTPKADITADVDIFMRKLKNLEDDDEDYSPKSHDAKVRAMGKELAGRFAFAILNDPWEEGEGGFSVQVCPLFSKATGWDWDQHLGIDALLPTGADCDMEGMYSFKDRDYKPVYKDAQALRTAMEDCGFKWERSLQTLMDEQHVQDGKQPSLQLLEAAAAPAANAPPKP